MISLKILRSDPEGLKNVLALKGDPVDINEILTLDENVRLLKTKANDLRAERNKASEEIGREKKEGKDTNEAIILTRELGDRLKEIETELHEIEDELSELLYHIPNTPHDSSPVGKDETKNIGVREWGQEPEFDFTPKTHIEIVESLGLLDFQRGAKLSGSGFPLYMGKGAQLERALINFMVDHHVRNYGFKEIFPPVLMLDSAMRTTGQLPKFEEDMYHTEVDHLYLA
ncbi:uncharacterized protein METZ01_LOCUS242129, partial [marine metagenome]